MPEEPDRPMVAYALDYLQAGRSVFPVCTPTRPGHCVQHGTCRHPGKIPLIAWDAYQERLPDPSEITLWWQRWPEANIGMATGLVSGVDVLDGDSPEARDYVRTQGIEWGPQVLTGKPGGTHWHLATEVVNRNFARKRPGLDFRGTGGYALLPPSKHETGARYRWAADTESLPLPYYPQWLCELFQEPAAAQSGEWESHESLDMELLLDGIPQGQRDELLYKWACRMRGAGVPLEYARYIMRQAARSCRPPFEEWVGVEKLERVWREFPVNTTLEVPGTAALSGEYGVMSIHQALAHEDEPLRQLVDGILWADRINWAFAAPGTGKTLFLTALGLHVAAGKPFHGRPVIQGGVVLLEEDSPLSVLVEYAETLVDAYGIDTSSLPFYVNREQGLRITDEVGIQIALRAIEQCPVWPTLVLLDACERIAPSSTFTTKESEPLLTFLQWCINHRITPVVIDHTRKLGVLRKDDKKPDPLDLLYGGRTKSAISDVMMFFEGNPKTGVKLTYPKFRGEPPNGLDFVFSPESGFNLKIKGHAQTPTQVKLMAVLNNQPAGWYRLAWLIEQAHVPLRSGQRALDSLVKAGWLLRKGEIGKETEFRLNPDLPSVFD